MPVSLHPGKMITLQQEEQTSSFMVVADEEEVQMMVRISACTTSFSLSNSHPSFFAGDRRGKRRRSPSPGGRGGADTYIPSYHRDRSPPYRERGGSGESAPSLPSFLVAFRLRESSAGYVGALLMRTISFLRLQTAMEDVMPLMPRHKVDMTGEDHLHRTFGLSHG